MPRRPAIFTQADVARAIRAAKQEGAKEIEVRISDKAVMVIRLSSTGSQPALEDAGEIVL
jgi:hypothetical protein